ncbi:MAG: putative hydrolase of HD superfamily [Candidatus Azotimanducaceae bacterium]|jgi:putative hydrolase of HD superfamily
MFEKAPIPVDLLDRSKSTPLIEVWYEIIQLKQLFRQGWIQRGIDPGTCETVAEHTFGNAMLSLMLLPRHPELDALRVLMMALVHDVGEAYVGDITPADNVPAEEKKAREAAAIHKILGKLPHGEGLIEVWEEYEAQQTDEAKFVKQIDRLEFAMQASVYEHQGKIDGDEFYEKVAQQMTSPDLQAEMAALRTLVGKGS